MINRLVGTVEIGRNVVFSENPTEMERLKNHETIIIDVPELVFRL